MRLLPLAIALLPALSLAQPAHATEGYQTPAGWRTECLGRWQFDMPSDTVWHLYMPYDNSISYTPKDPWFGRQIHYGSAPLDKIYPLVNIKVSPKTDLAAFERVARGDLPSKAKAQLRVLDSHIKATEEQYDRDKEDWEQHRNEVRYLEANYARYRKMFADIFVLNNMINNFTKDGRPTDKLKAELKGYEKEVAKLPTDKRYEKERAFKLGLPDAAGAWHPDKLIVHLWRNERIYTFEFGPRNGEFKSTFEALEPLARDVLARFRPRAEFEIPEEPGFCLPFGFIADDGTPHYDLMIAWHPAANPYLLHNLKLSDDSGDMLELLPMLTKRLMGNPFPGAVNIDNFAPRRIPIGNSKGTLTGRRIQAIEPEGDRLSPHGQYVFNVGAVAGKDTPTLLYKFESYANDNPPPPFEQAEAQVLNFMQSFRPLPGLAKQLNATEGND